MSAGAEPWQVGYQNMYGTGACGGAGSVQDMRAWTASDDASWKRERLTKLNEWGRKREDYLHRAPKCLMDQMNSGSGLFPPRMLNDTWFTPDEKRMVKELSQILVGTGRATELSLDMLTPLLYNIKVDIVLDDSGSMRADMFGPRCTDRNAALQRVTQPRSCCGLLPSSKKLPPAAPSPLSPSESRWSHAMDAMQRWAKVFKVLGQNPRVYQMNGSDCDLSDFARSGRRLCGGGTPSTETLWRALTGEQFVGRYKKEMLRHSLDKGYAGNYKSRGRRLIIILTDGEANDMETFMQLLDQCQNGMFGDVQICFLGISLDPADIEWFEEEECDETRIRTVEAYEVEQLQIRMREVVQQEAGYNFDMHSYRVLVTNFFPADYDYEAHFQNLRHRLYITIHGRDRWWSDTIPCWKCCSVPFCWGCFCCTVCHGCGWCQGNECGKYQSPECCDCGEE